MDRKIEEILAQIRTLHKELRKEIREKYNRTNPINENIVDWKEKGAFLFGKDKNITVYDNSFVTEDVTVGKNTWIGPGTVLDGTGGLTIGENCSISEGVSIYTHDTAKWAISGGKSPYEYEPVNIGNNCFIGAKTIIVKGVTIGNCCLVGAGSIVTKDLPDNSIAVGAPAKIIGKTVINGDGAVSYMYE